MSRRRLVAQALPCVLLWGLTGCLRLEGPPASLQNGDPCESSAQCSSTSVCEFDSAVLQMVCRTSGGCASHSACLADQACAFGSCVPAECTQTGTCGAYGCNMAVRQCFDSCAGDADCAAGNVCRDGECLSSTCTQETAARVCRGAACYEGVCDGEFDCDQYGCAPGYTCDVISCVKTCTTDAECERYTCYSVVGECNDTCYSESDCQPGYVCKNTFCQLQSP
jgi:hypothetical protein